MTDNDQTREEQAEAISYLREMLMSKVAKYGTLGSIAFGALLSIFLSPGFVLIGPLLWAALLAVAAMFIPSSPVFRDRVNRRKRAENREATRTHLYDQIREYGQDGDWTRMLHFYRGMQDHMRILREQAATSGHTLSDRDLDNLDETVTDFLRLWHLHERTQARMRQFDDSYVKAQIRQIDKAWNSATPADRLQLEKARAGLEQSLASFAALPARAMAIQGQLLAMGTGFDDLVHRVLADPSANATEFIMEQNARFGIEEELTADLDATLARIQQKAAQRSTSYPQ